MICLKIKNLKFKIAIAIVVLVLFFANTTAVKAQVISLSIWPPLLEVQMMPGKTVIQNYQLVNNTDSALEITPLLYPFLPAGENGQIKMLDNAPDQTDRSPFFFSFSSGEKMAQPFLLKPKETRQIGLKITLPKSSSEKDYYYTLLFSTSTGSPEKEKNQTASVTQIGTNILLTCSRVEKPPLLGRIFEFSAPQIIDSFSLVDFNLVLENFGATFFKPFGQISVTGIFGQKDEIKLFEQNVLANSKRKLLISSFKPKLPLGVFKAKLEFSLNEEGALPVLTKEISFWYLPYKLLSGLIVFILIIIFFKKT